MSTPKFAPFVTLLQFLLSSAACYIVLLNHLEEYQQCISPLANALALVLGVPARFDLRSEHLVITILQQGGIHQFQLGTARPDIRTPVERCRPCRIGHCTVDEQSANQNFRVPHRRFDPRPDAFLHFGRTCIPYARSLCASGVLRRVVLPPLCTGWADPAFSRLDVPLSTRFGPHPHQSQPDIGPTEAVTHYRRERRAGNRPSRPVASVILARCTALEPKTDHYSAILHPTRRNPSRTSSICRYLLGGGSGPV